MKFMKNNYYKLFSNCVIVKGASRSTICDLQRNKFHLIPNSLVALFDNDNVFDITKIKKTFSKEDMSIIKEYLDFLKENDFIFSCKKSEIRNFPLLPLEFDYPSIISNVIVDYDQNSLHKINDIITKILIPTRCRHIQVRSYDEQSFDFIKDIVFHVNESFIKSIELIIKYSEKINLKELCAWTLNNRKIKSIVIHSCDENKMIQTENYGFGIVAKVKQEIHSETHCGIINHNYFNSEIISFSERIAHNSCLNRKLSIDRKGNIKNCPSMKEVFGNISTIEIENVLNNQNFKKYWDISKDKIETCKVCEFRQVCTDCRAYLEDPENLYSKPLKCGYNPFTNEWENWSENQIKKDIFKQYLASSEYDK